MTSESYSQSFGQPQRLERSGPLLVGPAPVYSIASDPLNRENKENPQQPVSINEVFENIWSSQNLVDNVNIIKT